MRIRSFTLTALAGLFSCAVWAASPAANLPQPLSLNTLSAAVKAQPNTALATAFRIMVKENALPRWVDSSATPAQAVIWNGQTAYIMTGCKPHDCAAQRIAVLYLPEQQAMYGLLSSVNAAAAQEHLEWRNIGGGPESIDGRALLYMALTGTLANNPNGFGYQAPPQ